MKRNGLMVYLILAAAVLACVGPMGGDLALAARACQGDIAMFCAGAQGPKQELQCLKENRERLSPQCKMHIVQVLRAAREAHQDCEADTYMFCPGVRPGKGRILKCLKAHKQELTPECKVGIMDLLMSR
jgi:hypothetical protein